jgi:hypothetical protein
MLDVEKKKYEEKLKQEQLNKEKLIKENEKKLQLQKENEKKQKELINKFNNDLKAKEELIETIIKEKEILQKEKEDKEKQIKKKEIELKKTTKEKNENATLFRKRNEEYKILEEQRKAKED